MVRLRFRPFTLWTAIIALAASGCLGSDSSGGVTGERIQKAYTDADQRFHNQIGGTEQTTKTFNVAPGATRLTVKAIYSCGGVCDFALRDPASQTRQQDSISGGKQLEDETWFTTSNPTPGTWRLGIEISGGAQYTFGFYAEP